VCTRDWRCQVTDQERVDVLTKALKARDREIAVLANQVQSFEAAQERLIERAERAEAAAAAGGAR
jgi:hypothetical protein